MHILFINPPNQLFEDVLSREAGNDKAGPPLGALYLSAVVKEQHPDITTSLLDLQLHLQQTIGQFTSLEAFIHQEMQKVSHLPVDLCAITLSFNTNGESYQQITSTAKRFWPSCKTIIGGPIVSGDPHLFAQDTSLDFFCMGEGEISFAQFVSEMRKGKATPVPGIYERQLLLQTSVHLENSPQVTNLDSLPLPDYSLIEASAQDYQYGILTSRGCPNRCAYCSHSLISGKRMRFRNIALVLQEISYLYSKLGARYLAVFDSNVGLNKKPFLELLAGVRGIANDLELSFNPEITHLTVESLKAYREQGLKLLVVSIESGSPYVLTQLMLRRNYLEKARELVQAARDLEIDVRCLFVLGMHGETAAMRQETLEYAKSLAANWCTFYIATPVPGSKLYSDLKQEGHIRVNTPAELARIKFRNRTFDLPEMSAAETVAFQDDFEGQVNFVGSYNVQHGYWDAALANFRGIAQRFPHRMRAQLMILYLYDQYFRTTGQDLWKQERDCKRAEIQNILQHNNLAQQEYERYHQKPEYEHLFELLEGVPA